MQQSLARPQPGLDASARIRYHPTMLHSRDKLAIAVGAAALGIVGIAALWPARRPPPVWSRHGARQLAHAARITRNGVSYTDVRMFAYDPVFDTSRCMLPATRDEARNDGPEDALLSVTAANTRDWVLANLDRNLRARYETEPAMSNALNELEAGRASKQGIPSRLHYKFTFNKGSTCYAVFVCTRLSDGVEAQPGLMVHTFEDERWVQTDDLIADPFCAGLYAPLKQAGPPAGTVAEALTAVRQLAAQLAN
ncbi:MAG: hypothetical protein JXR37_01910 [Kiritimatiellae bacterium]|nr:hypothetical protein [Kiritimatiellia bacterium]